MRRMHKKNHQKLSPRGYCMINEYFYDISIMRCAGDFIFERRHLNMTPRNSRDSPGTQISYPKTPPVAFLQTGDPREAHKLSAI